MVDPRCVWEAKAILGEGPVWVEREAALYWVDIKKPAIHRYEPASGERRSWTPPFRVGSIAPRVGGGFIAGTDTGFASWGVAKDLWQIIGDPEPDRPRNRFNDGKVGPRGRFWAGTMDDAEESASGALYRLDVNLKWRRVDDGYKVTNGPAFSPDARTLYHSDSALQVVYAFDLDEEATPSNRREHLRFGEGDGYPDGMTTDAEGCLWIAFWDGWCVRRFSPEGERLVEIKLPVARPTSVAFGAERMWVTSASIGVDQPLAGGLFEIDAGVEGAPSYEFAG